MGEILNSLLPEAFVSFVSASVLDNLFATAAGDFEKLAPQNLDQSSREVVYVLFCAARMQ